MRSRHVLYLSIVVSMGLSIPSAPVAAQGYGPPTVSQAPPFRVPDSGYEVGGRTGLMHNLPNIEFVE